MFIHGKNELRNRRLVGFQVIALAQGGKEMSPDMLKDAGNFHTCFTDDPILSCSYIHVKNMLFQRPKWSYHVFIIFEFKSCRSGEHRGTHHDGFGGATVGAIHSRIFP